MRCGTHASGNGTGAPDSVGAPATCHSSIAAPYSESVTGPPKSPAP